MTFAPEQRFMLFDFETKSRADLRRVGSVEYARHPSTEIMCCAFKIGTIATLRKAPIQFFHFREPPKQRGEIHEARSRFFWALQDPSIILTAHNVNFEKAISHYVYALKDCKGHADLMRETMRHERWLCTATMAAAVAIPRHLEGAGQALGLDVQKDKQGHRIMLKLSKPRKPTKNNPSEWHENPEDFEKLFSYCKTDLIVETDLFLRLPQLKRSERELWLLDQKINFRGFTVDRSLAQAAVKMIAEETKNLDEETKFLTDGRLNSTRQVAELKEEIEKYHNTFLNNMQAKTIDDALAAKLVPRGVARRLLKIRRATSKTSTSKFQAFLYGSETDGRLRDHLLFHGASTGRWSGKNVQVQNITKGTLKPDEVDWAVSIIKKGNLELVRTCLGDPMEALSSCVRPVIKASDGYELFVGDYNAIEARVVFWLADHEEGLKAFRSGRDLYKEQAVDIYGVELQNVNDEQRFVGKQSVLGDGFGQGWKKFKENLLDKFGVDISAELAKKAVSSYRSTNKPVVTLWHNIEKAAIAAVKNPGKAYTINHTTWYVKNDFLWVKLPSGRKLAYREPTVKLKEKWGRLKPTLYYWSQNPKTKQWENAGSYYGILVENITQAIARDIMAAAMHRCETAGYQILLTVHDELVTECKKGFGTVDEFKSLMEVLPEWADGLPNKVGAWKGIRYSKK